jgi:hypothetical protein
MKAQWVLFFSGLCLVQALSAEVARADSYQNTPTEQERFVDFVHNYKGTLICEAARDFIYGKGITTYLVANPDTRTFSFSSYDNEALQWKERNVELTVSRSYKDQLTVFREVLPESPPQEVITIGVGALRHLVSELGDLQASPEYPYAGYGLYQFHNICKIQDQ